jgi:hypothetical protein
VRRIATIRRPDRWPVDSPPSLCPTDVDASVANQCSSSVAVMLTASRQSGHTSSRFSLTTFLPRCPHRREARPAGRSPALLRLLHPRRPTRHPRCRRAPDRTHCPCGRSRGAPLGLETTLTVPSCFFFDAHVASSVPGDCLHVVSSGCRSFQYPDSEECKPTRKGQSRGTLCRSDPMSVPPKG